VKRSDSQMPHPREGVTGNMNEWCYLTMTFQMSRVNWRRNSDIRFEVFTAVTMKNAVFWDVALCRSCELNRCFGGTCRLHLQGRKIRERGTSVSRWLQSASETSVQFTRSAWRHIPEDGTLQVATYVYLVRPTSPTFLWWEWEIPWVTSLSVHHVDTCILQVPGSNIARVTAYTDSGFP
jgi:hypothetical protein